MSFSLTTDQIRRRTKTVTRRKGWTFLRAGDLVQAVVKAMGLQPGETVDRLAILRVSSVRREPLSECTDADAVKEGFPELSGPDFVATFCRHMGGAPDQIITRIEFQYVPGSSLGPQP